MNEQHELISLLRTRQGDAGLTDGEMAKRLGISRALWQRLVAGERGVSLRVMQGAMAAFPDLTPQVLDFFLTRN